MMKTIIIDDEHHCVGYLQVLVQQHCPSVQVVATAGNGVEGLSVIRQHAPELVFLDIEMPIMNGFRMLEELGDVDFQLIFTTAYDRYALRAFKFSALDYLLKPIDPLELKNAVARSQKLPPIDPQQLVLLKNHLHQNDPVLSNKIAIPSLEGFTFLNLDDIVTCEAESNYTKIHLANGKQMLISRTLGDVEDTLEGKGFFRAHKQFLINLKHIEKYMKGDGGYVVMSNNQTVSIARSRREDFMLLFGRM
ncbi:MAG: response regulator transcription factor [Saprospiraceae bacterium]|nr:response regulator transcription factor [Saprospiraceae bacterium]